ncbi:MAG: hypothetical protein ABFC96_05990, partial [Thermoguttaceae bacterium]
PRATAPENRVDLSALRELANLSAHSALARHARRLMVSRMNSKLLVAGVAFASSVGLYWMSRVLTWKVTYYAAMASLLIGVYWGMHYLLLTGRLIIKSGHVAWNPATGPQAATAERESPEMPGPFSEPVSMNAQDAAADAPTS